MKADLHIHTNTSHDAHSSLDEIIEYAAKQGMDYIAITDHDVLSNAENRRLNIRKPKIIVGSEITTDKGTHIIGLFLKSKIKSKNIFSVMDEIKRQKGLVVLPHPFRSDSGLLYNFYIKKSYTSEEIERIISCCDIIELGNGKCKEDEIKKTKEFFAAYKKPFCGGSDAHYAFEVGETYTEFEPSSNISELKKALLRNNQIHMTFRQEPKGTTVLLNVITRIAYSFKKIDYLFVGDSKKIAVYIYEKTCNFLRRARAEKARKRKARL